MATTEWTAFFADGHLFSLAGIEDNSIDARHDLGSYESKLLQLYDGSLVLAGMEKLLWRQQEITQEDIQVLSSGERSAWRPH